MKYKLLALYAVFFVGSDLFAAARSISRSPSSAGSALEEAVEEAVDLLNCAIEEAKTSRSKRKEAFTRLRDAYRKLEETYDALQEEHEQLQTDHGELEVVHENLKEAYEQLKKDYGALTGMKRGRDENSSGTSPKSSTGLVVSSGRSPEASKALSPLALAAESPKIPSDLTASLSRGTGTSPKQSSVRSLDISVMLRSFAEKSSGNGR